MRLLVTADYKLENLKVKVSKSLVNPQWHLNEVVEDTALELLGCTLPFL